MSIFKVEITVANPKKEELCSAPIEGLVDTGSELTWLPGEVLQLIGITPLRKKTFLTATGDRIEREVGYAILRVDKFETIDEVVFGQKGDLILLGVRTLEGFAVMVDNIGHRLVASASLAVSARIGKEFQ
ncbi:MAG: hypothetical protein A2268_14995 [Candidatus Raymondbacteria bacterium RifOxyA12_full_50_37]|nr:MAG: hypothetical protein A2268_14995 [Candidatus Raymondbacteria bacterium RifOxyA12_full_50_37]OGJ88533.1 MAG: hypothetical protein A2248_20265 [Candidatus Raymondbacteria bacterium RIFOXYA2_FULL_49_16]OGJ98994.1 MAG: hypothetical protein A2453_10985 [Candidatus Raymondbacteria bacterium RIFOXYC2_FULL_50_21]OGK00630.1 MAG: hypothetical protein A2487_13830 [Candidatus Raymondbacteria bacterium RifOxyC12_full_50_8]OGP41504.1 MAG: hypothetical protein A2324_05795 [Candidatus Raymondbacteria b